MPKGPPKEGNVAPDAPDDSKTWEADQKNRGYYYDDSHGYEVYRPGIDDEEDFENTVSPDEKGPSEN